MKTADRKNGFALLGALMVSTIVIIITGTVTYKLVSTTQDIKRVVDLDKTMAVAEEGIEMTVDWMNNMNNPLNYTVGISEADKEILKDSSNKLYSSTLNKTYNRTQITSGIKNVLKLKTSEKFIRPINEEKNILYKTIKFVDAVTGSLISNITQIDLIGTLTDSVIPQMTNQPKLYYSNMNLDSSDKISGKYQIEASPVEDDNGMDAGPFDLIKLEATAWTYPEGHETSKIHQRKFAALLKRSLEYVPTWNEAIITDGNLNLQNAQTDDNDVQSLTAVGHVHTNEKLTIGSKGTVNGDASSSEGMYPYPPDEDQVTGTATQYAPEKPIPKPSYTKPTKYCTQTVAGIPMFKLNGDPIKPDFNNNKLTLEDCIWSFGDLGISGQQQLTIKGTVWIEGNYSESGQAKIAAGSTISKLVVQGDLSTSGNAATSHAAGNRMMFIGMQNIDLVGNSDVYGVFFQEDQSTNCGNGSYDIAVKGNATITGAIVSNCDVNFSGNNPKVVRDTSLNTIDFLEIQVDLYKMSLISWKELPTNIND